jgi:hypothetical protein
MMSKIRPNPRTLPSVAPRMVLPWSLRPPPAAAAEVDEEVGVVVAEVESDEVDVGVDDEVREVVDGLSEV